jgi:hypothetical protein
MAAQSTWTYITSWAFDGTSTGVQLNSIPQTYTDLVIVQHLRSNRAATTEQFWQRPNNDTGSNYGYTPMQGDGSTSNTTRQTSQTICNRFPIPAASATANIFGTSTVHIQNYTNTTMWKNIIVQWSCDLNGSGTVGVSAGTWRSTAAITSINLATENGSNPIVGSYVTVYGILAA